MKRKPPLLDIGKEVRELMKKLHITKDESGFWQKIDSEIRKKLKKGIRTK